MYIKYPLLIPIIGHGSTDIVDLPIQTLQIHFLSTILVYLLRENHRRVLLILSSIIHISRDIPHKNRLLISAGFHKLWLYKPIIAKLYLLLYHTPIHYIRNYKLSQKNKFILKCFTSITTTVLSFFGLKNNLDIKIEKKLGKYWWTAPVVGHIIMNEKINKINMKRFYKNPFRIDKIYFI
tara:strand:+ start:1043 stop:1582 length:540 start_codon:yes stop_codon:yes gene_type:complete